MKYNEIEITIKKDVYQNTQLQKENKTFIADDEMHTLYSVDIHKNYYTEDREKVLNELLNDLENLCRGIKEKLKEQERWVF